MTVLGLQIVAGVGLVVLVLVLWRLLVKLEVRRGELETLGAELDLEVRRAEHLSGERVHAEH